MKFKNFDEKMRRYEEILDRIIPENVWVVLRLDGRGFHGLVERLNLKKPFDERFIESMMITTQYLMTESGINFIYGYHQSDEISLLLHKDDNSFNRKDRKLLSVPPSLASCVFNRDIGRQLNLSVVEPIAFDCRISLLATEENVIDYFRWRQSDAYRNCINSYGYWSLREEHDARKSTKMLVGMERAEVLSLIKERTGLSAEQIPTIHRNGVGHFFMHIEKEAINKKTGEKVICKRRKIMHQPCLPWAEKYSDFLRRTLVMTTEK